MMICEGSVQGLRASICLIILQVRNHVRLGDFEMGRDDAMNEYQKKRKKNLSRHHDIGRFIITCIAATTLNYPYY